MCEIETEAHLQVCEADQERKKKAAREEDMIPSGREKKRG